MIVKRCLRHLINYRTINVPHFIETHLKQIKLSDAEFKSLSVRIRAKLLDNPKLTEVSGKDKYGYPRIGFKQKERWFWKMFFAAIIGAILSLITGYILWRIDNQSKHREKLQEQQHLNSLSDSVRNLQNKVDSFLKQ